MRVVRTVLHLCLAFCLATAVSARAQAVGATIPAGTSPAAITVNPVTNKVYVANEGSNTVTIVDGATNVPSTVAVGVRPTWIAANPETNKVYVANFGSPPSLMAINGVTDTVSTTMTMGDVGWTAINAVTNKVYVLRYGNGDEVNIVLDERYVNTAATRSYTPVSIALNPYTNILYIVHRTTGDVTAIDASVDQSENPDNANNYPPLLCPDGAGGYRPSPGMDDHGDNGPCINITDPAAAVTVNPVTNMIYTVSNGTSSQIAVIRGHGMTNPHTATFLTAPGVSGTARAIAVNPVSNKVYAVFENHVVVVNAAGGNAMTVIPASGAVAVGIDSSANTVYVPQSNGTLEVIDGATDTVTANLSIPIGAKAIAVNPVTHIAYVLGDSGVTPVVGAPATAAAIPLTTSITPFAGDSSGPSGSIALTAASSGGFAAPRKVYYQIDSTSGAWQAASGSGPYAASFSGLASGSHTIRAFATNALDAPSIVTDVQNNPLVGMIASYTFTVTGTTKVDPSISLLATPNPSTPGQSVTFTASVSGSAGTATGTIDFRDGAASIAGCDARTLSGGSATCTTSALTAGSHSITAVYSGDDSYNPGTSSPVAQVVKATSSVALTSSANPSLVGASVTFTATVSSTAAVNGGTVEFRDGATSLAGCSAVTVASGSAACTTSTLAVGSHAITAHYSGNSTVNGSSSSSLTQQVAKATPGVGLASSFNPSMAGASVTFTAAISGSAAAGTPTGSVSFRDGAAALAGCTSVPVASGSASCTSAGLAAGSHSITAEYSGNASYDAAGASLTQVVNTPAKLDAAVALDSSSNPSIAGGAVTFTATVAGSSGTPAGTVTFRDGASALCSAVALGGGAASCSTSALATGTHSITAEYSGDATYNARTSNALMQEVNAARVAASVGVAASANPSTAGQGVAFTATVSGSAGTPGGTVEFFSGSIAIPGCSAAALSGGSAACTTNALGPGTHSITARYSGDASYYPADSGAWTQTVLATLTVTKGGGGAGTVTSSPSGIECGATCSFGYGAGTVVTLTAAQGGDSTFAGWSGGGCSGTGTCTVTLDASVAVTATFTPVTTSNPARLGSLSTRGQVLTGNDVIIGGFIIGGATSKTVVVRARGPSLGVAGALQNPTLTLVPASGPAVANDDWQTASNAVQLQASGFAPGDTRESAILVTLEPGAYTAIVSGVGNATGLAIVEVLELDHPEIPLIGISTRGQVQTGDNVLIGGFIISGDAPQTVVVRARGPSLGVAGALQNPVLTLVPTSGPAITNDDWQSAANSAQLAASGFAPGDPREAAILITLNPGAYTAIVTGAAGTTGLAIVEVFAR